MECTADIIRFMPVLKNGLRAILIVVRFHGKKGSCTFLRIDSDDNWKKVIEGLENFQPAEWFNLKHLGIDFDARSKNFEKYLTVLDAKKRLPRWIFGENVLTDEEFRSKNSTCTNHAEETFNGKDIWEVEHGVWHYAEHINAKKYKTKRVIM